MCTSVCSREGLVSREEIKKKKLYILDVLDTVFLKKIPGHTMIGLL